MPLCAFDFSELIDRVHAEAYAYERSHGVAMPWWFVKLATHKGDTFAAECGRAVYEAGRPDAWASDGAFNAYYIASRLFAPC